MVIYPFDITGDREYLKCYPLNFVSLGFSFVGFYGTTAGLYLTDYFPPPTLVVVTFAHAVDIGKCNNENLAM